MLSCDKVETEKYLNIDTHGVYMKIISLTKKDIVSLNEKFYNGAVINESSLDYAISVAKKTTNWSKAIAYLIRAILIDHVFEEGNKRTAALLTTTYIDMIGYSYSKKKINNIIKNIVLKRIKSIRKIEEMIKDATE